jgi:hypothetical protein
MMKAHRFAYELLVGPIPDGLALDHLCLTTGCVNPAHLEPVTVAENSRRAAAHYHANRAKTHCIHGHPFDGENTYVHMTRGRPARGCKTCDRERARRNRAQIKHRLQHPTPP